jgi:uncharacterized membrane protein YhaH (DUF805 family)
MSLLHLLFGFSGRINRGKFWLAVVLWIVFWAIAVPICVLAAFMILGLHLPDSSLPSDELVTRYIRMAFDYLFLLIIIIAFFIVSWISAFAVGIKRLHDRNKSGWWILLFYLVPSVLSGIADTSEQPRPRSCSGSPLWSSRSGAWWSSASCAGPSAPTSMGPIRCRRLPARALRLRPHPPAPERLHGVRGGTVAAASFARHSPRHCPDGRGACGTGDPCTKIVGWYLRSSADHAAPEMSGSCAMRRVISFDT